MSFRADKLLIGAETSDTKLATTRFKSRHSDQKNPSERTDFSVIFACGELYCAAVIRLYAE